MTARVVLIGLDGFPPDAVRPDLAPRLWALGEAGGRAPDGGRASLPSSTYPGFASLLTGRFPEGHGVRTTNFRDGAVPGWAGEARVRVPTLFDACRAAGIACAAVQGDHLLMSVLRSEVADVAWPPRGGVPARSPLDAHGYPANVAVRPQLLAAAGDPRIGFLFGHLNEADTIGHNAGPWHSDALDCYRATDALVGEALEALAGGWERTIVVVVSDHDMEPRTASEPIDLLAHEPVRAVASDALGDGGAALVRPRPGVAAAELEDALGGVDGVTGWSVGGPEVLVVETSRGRIFADRHLPAGGYHGGRATERTVALVGGGHPAVGAIAAAIRGRPPHLADWAPTIARLLGLPLPGVDGRDLAAD